MAYQDRRHHADHGDSGRRRRDGDRHGFGSRKRFEGDHSSRSRRHDRHGESSDAPGRSRRPNHDERASHQDGQQWDDRRGERRRDGGFGEKHPDRGGRKASRYNDRSGRGNGRDRRDDHRGRPPQRQRVPEPPVLDEVEPADLERGARNELRALGRANAENVARHLVMVQRLLENDPQTAYEHARYATSHAGRVAVVRETAGIAAYLAGHYNEALREIRAARRLSGIDLHRAIEVDCERALGNVDKALQAAKAADPRRLDEIERAELAMVVSSLRHEMGQTDLGLIIIEDAIRARPSDSDTLRRLHSVRADRLEELGRLREAAAIRDRIGPEPTVEDEVEVFDIEEDYDAETPDQDSPMTTGEQADAVADAPADDTEAPGEPAEASTDMAADLDAADQDDDAEWSQSFAERVEAEMAELLEEAGEASASPSDATDETTTMTTSADDAPEEPR